MTGTREATDFLRWLDPTGWHNLVAIHPVTKTIEGKTFPPDSFDAITRWIAPRNGEFNLYFSINEPRLNAPDQKLAKSDISNFRAFAVDLDHLPDGYPWGDPIEDYPPSATVRSGNGQWGFWRLQEKIPADRKYESQNKALAEKFAGDPVSTDICRIARLPGTLNIPNQAKRDKGRIEQPASVLRIGGPTYAVDEIANWCPPSDAPIVERAEQTSLIELDTPDSIARATAWLIKEAPEAVEGDNGDGTTYEVCTRLKDFGVSKDAAFDLLLDHWNPDKAIPSWDPSDLREKVRNAFAYGTALPGRDSRSLAEVEFGDETASTTSVLKRPRLVAEDWDAIEPNFSASSDYLIEDWYDKHSLVVTYGESGSGKTHVVLSQAHAIATGRTWAGKRVQQGLVVYAALEGGKGFPRRVKAYKKTFPDDKNVPFVLLAEPINLKERGKDDKLLLSRIREAEARHGLPCAMVIVDTMSRALAGGDENSSVDVGGFVENLDRLRAATGATFHVIHHSGKNAAKGQRGWSGMRAAVDTEIEVAKHMVRATKQREQDDDLPPVRFDYQIVELGIDGSGKAIKSVVLKVGAEAEFELEIEGNKRLIFDAVKTLEKAKKATKSPSKCPSRAEIIKALSGTLSEATVDRGLRDLLRLGVVDNPLEGKWKTV